MILLEILLFFLGFSYLLKAFTHVYNFVILLFCRTQVFKYGKSWALVTACTDGIGLGFTHELARLGFNIVQVGRNPEKLKNCEKLIKQKYGVDCLSIVKDFSICNQNPIQFFNDVFMQLGEIDLSLLVNNIGTVEIGRFLADRSLIIQQNTLNLFPVVFMTKLFVDRCRNRKLGGGVINMSSLTAEFVTPFIVTYAAGKSFGKVFTQVLATESRVDMLSYEPGYVWTPLGSKFKFKFAAISHLTCAKLGVRALGNVGVYIGHWTHYICFLLYWIVHLSLSYLITPFRKIFSLA